MKPSETVCYNIKSAWHAIYRMYNVSANKHDITTSIGYVLLNIDVKKGTPATKIAPLIGLEARSLTRMLKNLETDGMIYRQADEKDKRMVYVFLTELGKQKRNEAKNTVLNFNQQVMNKLGAEKLQAFFQIMSDIQKTIEQVKVNE